ncbi:hypothetical protein VTN96DRAFT_352 [Rasamsonia emersonii]
MGRCIVATLLTAGRVAVSYPHAPKIERRKPRMTHADRIVHAWICMQMLESLLPSHVIAFSVCTENSLAIFTPNLRMQCRYRVQWQDGVKIRAALSIDPAKPVNINISKCQRSSAESTGQLLCTFNSRCRSILLYSVRSRLERKPRFSSLSSGWRYSAMSMMRG